MTQHSLGEFEELVLLMVAALHDEGYGVTIL
jgi:PadR family transcriptional regulator PadR